MAEPLLKVENLHKSFGSLEVLKGIDLELAKGEKIALIGPSGCGKSTCLRCVNFLEIPNQGHIYLDGELFGQKKVGDQYSQMSEKELARQRATIGMVFQGFYLWPHLNVRDNVAIAQIKVNGMAKSEANDLAMDMLKKVHMDHKSEEFPERLSGGQQQRVAIARALAQRPKLLLFDEPTSALDPELVGEVLNTIHELADEGRAMMLVTHEIAFAREVADRVVFMDGGGIAEQGPAKDIIDNPQNPRLQSFLGQMLERN
ncbi:MAG: amino acid ABC transporter ATP-binding protein [Rhodobacteraceae bacterium]|nr:amino acid ABC transporter ATP-binding protein [Paracoccaceae bacterium]